MTLVFIGTLPLELIDGRGKKYIVKHPLQTGGKAGKGNNKTSSIQVMYNDMRIKNIVYTISDILSQHVAIKKAIDYCVGPRESLKYFR
jgi:hypothetical protein